MCNSSNPFYSLDEDVVRLANPSWSDWPDLPSPVLSCHHPSVCPSLQVTLVANRAVTYATWPHTMERLDFGEWFNRPVEGVVFPPGVAFLAFGARFNQPVARVNWPPALQVRTTGDVFGVGRSQ